jgi:hypothetical protein
MKTIKLLSVIVALGLFTFIAHGAGVFNVPGTSSPWLAGMPNGSAGGCSDTAPAESPVEAAGIQVGSGAVLTFSASGGAFNYPSGGLIGPEGDTNDIYSVSPMNGMGSITAPKVALVGVFLDDNVPSGFSPPPPLDFSTAAERDFLVLQPALRQPFFIGDGLTSGGVTQQFVAPAGATRLFLGIMDNCCYDNSGSFSVTVEATATANLTNGLVAYYPLDGNANDASGNGFNGVPYNVTPTTNRFGQASAAMSFDTNGGSYIDCGSPSLLQFTGDFSVTAWVNPSGGTLNPRIVSYGADSGYELLTGQTTSNRNFGVNLGGTKFNEQSIFFAGEWHFVACLFAGSNAYIFVDGAFVVTNDVSTPPIFSGDLNLGRKSLAPFDNYWGGAMDEVRFYNRALSTAELNLLFTLPEQTNTATAIAVVTNGFVIGATITDGGCGYTNTPIVRFIGGGGSGAQGFAVMSNGVITSVTVTNAGFGYTSTPLVVIAPPFIPNPVLGIAPLSFLTFSNLTVGGVYQLQQFAGWYWTNQPLSFTATNSLYTQMVAGVWGSADFRLALNPVPAQAFATPQVVNGFVVGATVTVGGSGYVTPPALNIYGDVGSNATAVASVSGGAVTNISITDAGIGYTNFVEVQIAPPPAAAVFPMVQPVIRVDSANLAPYDNYQIQFEPDIRGTWVNSNGGLFTPTDMTNSQYLFVTNSIGFFRLQYVP